MYRRVIVVIADGLRPDAVTAGRMPTLAALGADYTRAVSARTVRPSATVAALTSLATGVGPETHGLIDPGLGFPVGIHALKPLARELARHGHTTAVVASELGFADRQVVWALAKSAGVGEVTAPGVRRPRPRGRVPDRRAAFGTARMMRYVTHLGSAGVTVLVPVVLIVMGGAERAVGLAALVANAISNLVVQVLKRVVARPRPCDASGRPLALVPLPDPFSFPSGHASASTAVAVTVAAAHPWLGPVLVPLAILVAASRVTLKVHHRSDVVAGVLLGLAGAVAALTLLG